MEPNGNGTSCRGATDGPALASVSLERGEIVAGGRREFHPSSTGTRDGTKMIGVKLATYLIEALELLDRVDRLLAAGARLAHFLPFVATLRIHYHYYYYYYCSLSFFLFLSLCVCLSVSGCSSTRECARTNRIFRFLGPETLSGNARTHTRMYATHCAARSGDGIRCCTCVMYTLATHATGCRRCFYDATTR